MFEAWGRTLHARRRLTLGITLVPDPRSRWPLLSQGRTSGSESNHCPFGLGFAGTVATQQWLSGCEAEPL